MTRVAMILVVCIILTTWSETNGFVGRPVQSVVKRNECGGSNFLRTLPSHTSTGNHLLETVRAKTKKSTSLHATSSDKSSNLVLGPIKKFTALLVSFTSWVGSEISSLNQKQKLLFTGVFVLGFLLGRVRPFWKRFLSTLEIPAPYFDASGSASALKGRVASVSDGDTIRFLHVPTMLHPKVINKKKQKLSETTLPVRMCTIDTPETAKFGKKGQPFGVEAKEHLANMLENKPIFVKLLQKDQYGRIVGQVYTKSWGRKKYVDEEMLKAGFAEVYQGGGAVYGPRGKEYYEGLEQDAKKAKIGIWSQGKRESAAEYKKRNK